MKFIFLESMRKKFELETIFKESDGERI
jgi:hypothetical protein